MKYLRSRAEPTAKDLASFRVEAHEANLGRVNGWTVNADTKAAAVVAFNAGLAGTLASKSDAIRQIFHESSPVLAWVIGATLTLFAVMTLIAGLYAYHALFPRTKRRNDLAASLLFFGSVAERSLEDFRSESVSLTPTKLEEQLIEQIHTNSTIAARKFSSVRHAIRFTFAAIVFWILAFGLAIGSTYRASATSGIPVALPTSTPAATSTSTLPTSAPIVTSTTTTPTANGSPTP